VIVIILLLPLAFKPYRDLCYKIAADFFFPFLSAPISIKNTINSKSLLAETKQDLIAKVFKLQRKNIELEAKCKYLESFKDENVRLKNLLSIKPLPKYDYLYAEVSFRDPSKWYQQFVINKGEDDRVKNGSIVLAQSKNSEDGKIQFAVVGRIGLLSKHTSVVYTLLSNECQLSVSIPANGANGILRGGERSSSSIWSDINYLPKDLVYPLGSLVTTSGLSTLAPRGLTIGKLDTPRTDDSAKKSLYENARVELAADLNHIDCVLVLVE
ncbi:MAG: rod shape-determining protein MreC, partial [Lentisphaerota bacterium]